MFAKEDLTFPAEGHILTADHSVSVSWTFQWQVILGCPMQLLVGVIAILSTQKCADGFFFVSCVQFYTKYRFGLRGSLCV